MREYKRAKNIGTSHRKRPLSGVKQTSVIVGPRDNRDQFFMSLPRTWMYPTAPSYLQLHAKQ